MRPFAALRGLAVALVVALAVPAPAAHARATPEALPEVAPADLPTEARETLARIRAGGPFPYERDGVRFGNREGLLPPMPRGHYREYTVKTPGAKNRGTRRIVCGGPRAAPETCYYTHDHYRSFARIRE